MAAFQPKKRSTYSSNSSKSGSGSASKSDKPQTSHYAYVLQKDNEGNLIKDENGKAIKEFVNGLFIYENETEYGTYLKVLVAGDLPPKGSEIYISKKRKK